MPVSRRGEAVLLLLESQLPAESCSMPFAPLRFFIRVNYLAMWRKKGSTPMTRAPGLCRKGSRGGGFFDAHRPGCSGTAECVDDGDRNAARTETVAVVKWAEVASRFRGFGASMFGFGLIASYAPPRAEVTIVQDLFTFLEDRRVLYNDWELEVPRYCVESVQQIRQHLTTLLRELPNSEGLPQHLRVMRGACREFMDAIPEDKMPHGMFHGGFQEWHFCTALGKLRATLGMHIGLLAAKYQLGIEGDLATILPPMPEEDDSD